MVRSRIEFCKRIEENYGDQRQVDSERPLVKIDGTRGGDETVTYDQGGWVMWMLLQCMGREQTLEGLQAFVGQYTGQRDHPVLQDLIASLRPFAPDVEAFDTFVEQWFFDVVVPEYRLSAAERVRVSGDGAGEATGDEEGWRVSVEVENVGSGRMPIEIAATRGDRFAADEEGSEIQPDYREVRSGIVLGAGETETVTPEILT